MTLPVIHPIYSILYSFFHPISSHSRSRHPSHLSSIPYHPTIFPVIHPIHFLSFHLIPSTFPSKLSPSISSPFMSSISSSLFHSISSKPLSRHPFHLFLSFHLIPSPFLSSISSSLFHSISSHHWSSIPSGYFHSISSHQLARHPSHPDSFITSHPINLPIITFYFFLFVIRSNHPSHSILSAIF